MSAVAMDHVAAQALFSELEDGELAAPVRAQLEQHLIGCASCRGEHQAFRRTLSALRGAGSALRGAGSHRADGPEREIEPAEGAGARSVDELAASGPSPEFMDSLKAQIHARSRGRFFGQRRRGYKLEIVSLLTLLVAMTVYLVLSLSQPMWMIH